MKRSRRGGFTLIELLIVVAIIAILAAIAVPNFLETQTRAKATRAMNDLRAINVALEAYHVDNNKYPSCSPDFDGTLGLRPVTTPVAYIVGVNTRDIFARETATGSFESYGYSSRDFEQFAVNGDRRSARWFVLTSNAPDLDLDDYGPILNADNSVAFLDTIYDPTNGAVSNGNIYRSGGNMAGPGANAARRVLTSEASTPAGR